MESKRKQLMLILLLGFIFSIPVIAQEGNSENGIKPKPDVKYINQPLWSINSNIYEVNLRQYAKNSSFKTFEKITRIPSVQILAITSDKKIILVFNKIDAYTFTPLDDDDLRERTRLNLSLDELKRTWMAGAFGNDCVFISAQKKINIDELRHKLYQEVKVIFAIRYPYNNFLY